LVGPGGVGKTRLAIECAALQQSAFPDGVYFVPLAPLNSVHEIPGHLADILACQFHPPREPAHQILSYLRGKQVLLIMDNFEHLLDGVELVMMMLEQSAHLKILTTSRELLNVQEEWVWHVPGMECPEGDTADHPEKYGAVQLFTERARRLRNDLSLVDDGSSITRICQMAEGFPLAIELAASWLKVLSCNEIVTEMQKSLDFLTTTFRDMPPRHRSIRAVFNHSWSLLTEEEQKVFERLSIFRGGFAREAAEQIAGASLTTLAALIDKSLLRKTASERYTIHELLRQYGAEQLEESGAADAVANAYSQYYANFIYRRAADLKGRRQLEAMSEIDVDFENVRAGWNWAVKHCQLDTIATALEGIELYCELRDRKMESFLLFQAAQRHLAQETKLASHPTWGQLLARTALKAEDPQPQLENALQIARRCGDQKESAYCLNLLGQVAHRQRDYAKSRRLLEQSLVQYRQVGDQYEIANALWDLMVYDYGGGPARFRARAEEGLHLRRDLGDKVGISWSVGAIAVAEAELGHFREAERLFFDRASLCQEMGNSHGVALSYAHLGRYIYFVPGKFDKARSYCEQALKIAKEINVLDAAGWAVSTLGLLACMEEEYVQAKHLCQQAADVNVLVDICDYAALGLSISAIGLGDYETASSLLAKTLNYVATKQNRVWMIACLPVAALIVAQRGLSDRAVELLALAFTHPIAAAGWMAKWRLLNYLRASLENDLGTETYAAAWTRGKSLKLENTITVLLPQFPFKQNGTNVAAQSPPAHSLTRRELEVLGLVAAGLSNQQIAQEFVITPGTVKWYISQIYEKLSVRSRTQAVARARELNILL
jgi:predicted ATPase/DNA-binding CsgD family transcriptional regulator